MYDILKKLNAIEQTTASADKTKLQESVEAIAEVTPPGREKQVKALKKVPGITNPYAVSWASYNKSHKKEESIEESDLEEGFDDLEKYMKGKQGPESKGGEGKKAGTRYGGSAQKDDAEDDDADDQDKEEKSKGGRKVGSKSGARHSYKKIDEYIAEAYGDFFESDLEENLEEAQIDAQASNQYGMKIVDALNQQFGDYFSYKANQDGSFTVVQKAGSGPANAYDPRYENDPNVLTPQSVSKVIDPYYNMFRQKGWRFDQPVGGQFTIAIPAQQVANEDDMEEGNLFTKGLEDDDVKIGDKIPGTNAIKTKDIDTVEEAKSCNHTMEGEECPVHGESKCPMEESANQELEEVRALAGLKECGDMSPIAGGDDTGKMSISSNMDSDGHKTVTISADGDSAVALMQMLKLAGMSGSHVAQEPAADDGETYDVATVSTDEEMGEDHIPGHLVGNGTEPQTMPVQALTKGGTGEVAGKEKQMHPGGYKFSDNPLAMENKLGGRFLKEYESIKLAKGK